MRTGRTILLMSGIVTVFVGTAKTLEGMGAQNAISACLVSAIVATLLMGALSR